MEEGTLELDDCRVSDVDGGAAAFIDSFKFHRLGLGSVNFRVVWYNRPGFPFA